MALFPVILDPTTSYLTGRPVNRSLLLTPIGSGTLLCRLHAGALSRYRLTIVPDFPVDGAYRQTLVSACGQVQRIVEPDEFQRFLGTIEPSDHVFFVDPVCAPLEALEPDALLQHPDEAARFATHLVALDANVGGTREWVEFDAHGEVDRIQRYYDDVTWSYAAGVAASLVPVWCLRTAGPLPLDSLRSLRAVLAERGVPGRDVPITTRTFDLSRERGLLGLAECTARAMVSGGTKHVAADATIHESARLIGPVVVQSGARIDRDAVILGPAVIGAGAVVESAAVVVQSVVRRDVHVPAAFAARHQVVSDGAAEARATEARSESARYDPASVEAFRSDLDDQAPRRRIYPIVKLLVESGLAIIALIILSPLLALIAILIKIESAGPVLFGDRREARGGRTFRCLKFRTMVQNAEDLQHDLLALNEVDGPQFKLHKDPRVTLIGRWIRPTSLDELPQLINVARGEMSVIGPRPSPFRENQTCVPWRDGRLSVRPGITGLWQVCRHQREQGDFHQWIQYDLLYIRHMSPLVDLKIAIATILTLGGTLFVPLRWIIPAKKLPLSVQ